jgi:adenylyltransferase/sulfurtransferase
MVFNGVGNQFYTTKLPHRDDCLSHESYPQPVALPIGNDSPASVVFEHARKSLAGTLSLALERDLVTAVECPRCGWRLEVFRPRTRVAMSEAVCPNCREVGHAEVINGIEAGSPVASQSLAKLGIPRYDIVRVDGDEHSEFFLLAGDR